MDFENHALGTGQVRLDVGKLEKLAIQLALQGERLAQARLVAGQPGFRVGEAAFGTLLKPTLENDNNRPISSVT
jgi:hypothetical protein